MIIVISPSKTQDFDSPNNNLAVKTTLPRQLDQSIQLIAELKAYSISGLANLMGISDKLAALNHQRFKQFSRHFSLDNGKQALLAFKGDVYRGIRVHEYNTDDFAFAQKQLRILSGLYGVLRPLDLIQPYRLEMSTKLNNKAGANLYQFWGQSISNTLNQDETECIVNLASNEYFKAVDKKSLTAQVIDIVFKEKKRDKYQTIGQPGSCHQQIL